jgi:hypothetical protein
VDTAYSGKTLNDAAGAGDAAAARLSCASSARVAHALLTPAFRHLTVAASGRTTIWGREHVR